MSDIDKANQMAEQHAVDRLRKSIDASDEKLEKFRSNRVFALNQFVGSHYGNARAQELPMNVLAGAVLSIVPNLVTGIPRASCTGKTFAARQRAHILAFDLNAWMDEMAFDELLRLIILDGMMGPAVLWTGIGSSKEVTEDGDDYRPPVKSLRVSLDDYGLDPDAKEREAALWEAHVTELPYANVMDSPLYSNKDDLKIDPGQDDGKKRAASLSRKDEARRNTILDVVRAYEVFMPRGFDGREEPLIATIPMRGQGDLPLRVDTWDGPEGGPYTPMEFYKVPDNALALPPVAVFLDLHVAINRFVRKMFRSMDREKVLGLIEETYGKDADTIRRAEDGDLVGVKDLGKFQEAKFGGAGPDKAPMLSALLQFFSRQAGNIDLIAGLENVAPTLGQEQMLAGSAGVRIEDMRQAVRRCVRKVLQKVAHYRYIDPNHEPTFNSKLPNTDVEVPEQWGPELRAGAEPGEYEVDIQATSWRPDPPEKLAEKIVNVTALGAQLGVGMDPYAVIRRVAELQGIEEIDDLLAAEPPAPMDGSEAMPGEETGGPAPGRIVLSRGPAQARPAVPATGGVHAPGTKPAVQPAAAPAQRRAKGSVGTLR